MLWDARAIDDGAGEGVAEGSLSSLYNSLTDSVPRCLMRWDHWVEMVVPQAHLIQVSSA